jgi:hypothetical protein
MVHWGMTPPHHHAELPDGHMFPGQGGFEADYGGGVGGAGGRPGVDYLGMGQAYPQPSRGGAGYGGVGFGLVGPAAGGEYGTGLSMLGTPLGGGPMTGYGAAGLGQTGAWGMPVGPTGVPGMSMGGDHMDRMGHMGQVGHMGQWGQTGHMGQMAHLGHMGHMGQWGQMGEMRAMSGSNHMQSPDGMRDNMGAGGMGMGMNPPYGQSQGSGQCVFFPLHSCSSLHTRLSTNKPLCQPWSSYHAGLRSCSMLWGGGRMENIDFVGNLKGRSSRRGYKMDVNSPSLPHLYLIFIHPGRTLTYFPSPFLPSPYITIISRPRTQPPPRKRATPPSIPSTPASLLVSPSIPHPLRSPSSTSSRSRSQLGVGHGPIARQVYTVRTRRKR